MPKFIRQTWSNYRDSGGRRHWRQHLEIGVLGFILVVLLAILANHPLFKADHTILEDYENADAVLSQIDKYENPTLKLEAPEIGH